MRHNLSSTYFEYLSKYGNVIIVYISVHYDRKKYSLDFIFIVIMNNWIDYISEFASLVFWKIDRTSDNLSLSMY